MNTVTEPQIEALARLGRERAGNEHAEQLLDEAREEWRAGRLTVRAASDFLVRLRAITTPADPVECGCRDINSLCTQHAMAYQNRWGRAANE